MTYTKKKHLRGLNSPAPEVCKSRTLGSKANTPEADKNKEKSVDGKEDETGQDQISPDLGGTSEDRSHIKPGKGDYQHMREANIAKNKELLRGLGLLNDFVDEMGKGTKKKGKKKERSKGLVAPMRLSRIARYAYTTH